MRPYGKKRAKNSGALRQQHDAGIGPAVVPGQTLTVEQAPPQSQARRDQAQDRPDEALDGGVETDRLAILRTTWMRQAFMPSVWPPWVQK
jgi:hypothetical protein